MGIAKPRAAGGAKPLAAASLRQAVGHGACGYGARLVIPREATSKHLDQFAAVDGFFAGCEVGQGLIESADV
jgi:hypothetical protein